jgi:inosine-uridine nucleoside N-ribohydrolase
MVKLLIDCDTGIDDSIAILFALKRPDVRVMGLISGCGNTNAYQAADNNFRLIKLASPDYEVPVAIGANKPIKGEWMGANPNIHGKNGIGEASLPPSDQKAIQESGPEFIVRMARENPGELTLVTLGQMTNLALALDIEPKLPKLFKEVVAMGGNVKADGNVSPCAEANIAGDPEAADKVLMADFNLTLVGLDVTMKTCITKNLMESLDHYIRDENRPIYDYMKNALDFYFRFSRVQDHYIDKCPVHDPLAVLAAVDPTRFTFRKLRARIECGGTYSRGMIVTDERAEPMEAPFTTFCVDVEGDKAIADIMTTFMDQTYAYENE